MPQAELADRRKSTGRYAKPSDAHLASREVDLHRGKMRRLDPITLLGEADPLSHSGDGETHFTVDDMKPCRSFVSLEGRIVVERWAPTESCKKPMRTRATDRFLGFSCL